MNGNGLNGNTRYVVIGGGLVVSLFLGALGLARDTPTRTEMEAKDKAVEMRLAGRLDRIEVKLDRLLEQGRKP